MSFTFTKLFSSITSSTIWVESPEIKVVWITMLAMADRKGRVFASIPGLAKDAVVSVEATRKAVTMFLAPDPDSRTRDYEGRRIEEIDGGWRLLNYIKYREIRDEVDRREYLRLHKAKLRLKAAAPPTVPPGVAESVLTASSISDPRMIKVIADAIEMHAKANPDWTPEKTAARMIEGYKAYGQANANGNLRYTIPPRKFFSQGYWLTSEHWPFDKTHRSS